MNKFLKEALIEAYEAYKKGEVPVGCVIEKDGQIIARGHNLVETLQRSTAHAEILAIEQANRELGVWRLEGCDLYVTLEPCAMCLGAIINARIKTIHIGARDPERGAVIGKIPILKEDLIPCKTDAIIYDEPVCSYILSRFFRELRRGRILKYADRQGE
ncbi:MAG: nucleoside deaminase [Peptostreptococcaceae bacterium]|nr:nucleoside deaminase [Peptostreptococcaceae bacterium]